MRTRVPAVAGQIDAATEGEPIINHDDLLMMRAADWMMIVKAKSHVAMGTPAKLPSRPWIALERVECGVVPNQDVTAQLWPPSGDEGQQFIKFRRPVL